MVILGLEPADFGHWHCNVTLNDGKSINESRVLAERSDGARMVSMSQFKSTVHHHQFKEKQHHHENINADYNDYQEAYTENEYEDAVQFPQFRTLTKNKKLSLDTNQNSTERPKDTPSLTSFDPTQFRTLRKLKEPPLKTNQNSTERPKDKSSLNSFNPTQFRTLRKLKEPPLDTTKSSTQIPKETPSLTSLNEEYDKPSVGGENEALREYDVVHTLLGDEEAFKEYKKLSEKHSEESNHTILITPL